MKASGAACPGPRRPQRRRFQRRLLLLGALMVGVFTLAALGVAMDTYAVARGNDNSQQTDTASLGKLDKQVSPADLQHLSLLHEACVSRDDVVIPWTYGDPSHQLANGSASNSEELLSRQDHQKLLDTLRHCPDVDVFLPGGLRGNGYCEDAVAYAKYLQSRLLPMWVFELQLFDEQLGRQVTYFDLCPDTPTIFFNHYWDGLPDSPHWPASKPLYLMPNIEMVELQAEHLWRADVVLCKTHVCHDRAMRWFLQQGNPRNTTVLYTKHTSSDPASRAQRQDAMGDNKLQPQDFADVKFVHTAGTSIWKGTKQLVDCWVSQRGLPPLDIYIADSAYHHLFTQYYPLWLAIRQSPVRLIRGDAMTAQDFGVLLAQTAFFLCPSLQEGYGHYINQARAAGGVVITTDAQPMNELIWTPEMGVLVSSPPSDPDPRMLLGGTASVELHGLQLGPEDERGGFVASLAADDVCHAVKRFVATTDERQRAAMGARVRQEYHRDTLFFARAMKELRALARNRKAT